ncbi:hypothetical protein L4C36_18100 [Photobacterium japonica]|uniref:hypothetical protein n=1 Tax=Photobacterium japonica TaxID=2910235 RepID=UPI003D10EE10
MKKILLPALALAMSGCASVDAPAISNATIIWLNGEGTRERIFITPSMDTVTSVLDGEVFVLKKSKEDVLLNGCIRYNFDSMAHRIAGLYAELCGNEVTGYLPNDKAFLTGILEIDPEYRNILTTSNLQEVKRIRNENNVKQKQQEAVEAALIAEREREIAEEQAVIKAKKAELAAWKLEQEKRRIEAETRALEDESDMTKSRIDAENKAIISIGKGYENHGVN